MADQQPAKARKLLFLTNVDYGESNVFLATCQALLQIDPDVELHFATFSGLETSLIEIWHQARTKMPQAKQIVFHKIAGLSMAEGVRQCLPRSKIRQRDDYLPESFMARPGIWNTPQAIQDSLPIFIPYTGPQMVEIFRSITDIIEKVDADLLVVNSLMTAGLTACYHSGRHFVCLSPNSIKDFAAPLQPNGVSLWKYPALFSGYSYPVPWYLIPLNVSFVIYTVISFSKCHQVRTMAKYLKSHAGATLRTPVDLLRNRPSWLKVIVSSTPEIDYPLIVPPHVLPCGPILRSTPPLSVSDPDLLEWLEKAPTVYINLGSICLIDEKQACEMATALKSAMDALKQRSGNSRFQVLWKLRKHGNYGISDSGCKLEGIIGAEIRADVVRIVDWIKAEPISILRSGHVACAIHHGGANSYNEAISSGVPQVVLPQWTDCYDYAQRVELLGVGRWGSKRTKPTWSSADLTQELLDILSGESAEAIKNRCVELAKTCNDKGSGAMNAAQMLLLEC